MLVLAFFIFVSFRFFSLLLAVAALVGVGLAVDAVKVRDGDAFGGCAAVEATLGVDAGEALATPVTLVAATAATGEGLACEAVVSVGVLALAALEGGAESATTVEAGVEEVSDAPVVGALTAYLTAAAEGMGEEEDDVDKPREPKDVAEVEATV